MWWPFIKPSFFEELQDLRLIYLIILFLLYPISLKPIKLDNNIYFFSLKYHKEELDLLIFFMAQGSFFYTN